MATEYAELIALVNKANTAQQSAFVEADLTLDTIATATGAQNTTAVLHGVEARKFVGQMSISYNRLDLGTYFDPYKIQAMFPKEGGRTADVVAGLNKAYGWNFTADQFVDEAIPAGTQTYELKAVAGAIKWIGKVSVKLTVKTVPLSEVIVVQDLVGFNYQVAPPLINGVIYTWNTPESTHAYLFGGSAGIIDAQYLPVINPLLPDVWVDKAGSENFNIAGARKVSFGANVEANWPTEFKQAGFRTNPAFANACFIKLDATRCKNVGGWLVFYNTPR